MSDSRPIKTSSIGPRGLTASVPELVALRNQALSIPKAVGRRVYTAGFGPFVSGFRGRGMDFDEVRLYQAPDDIRSIDWRVTARTGRPYTKLFCEERERPHFIVVDMGPTMFFGTRVALKSVIAARWAAITAWFAALNGDRVGGLIFSGEMYKETAIKSGQRGVLPFLKQCAGATDRYRMTIEGHDIGEAFKRVRRVVKPGSSVTVISDFYHANDAAWQHLLPISKHNEVRVIMVLDPLEKLPPPPNLYAITDGLTTAWLDTSQPSVVKQYREYFRQHYRMLYKKLHGFSIPIYSVSTHDDVRKITLWSEGDKS